MNRVENLISNFLREDLPANCKVSYEAKTQTLILIVSSAKDLQGASLRHAWGQTIDTIIDCCFTVQNYAVIANVHYQCGELSYPEFNPARYAAVYGLYRSTLSGKN